MDPVASAAAPQVAKKWAAEMPGPSPIRRPTVEEKYGKPAPAPISAAQARAKQKAFAEAYAMKHGRLMAPPTRRGIVPHDEIAAAVAAVGEDAPPVYDHGQLLTAPQAADYLGIAATTFSKWKKLYGCPVAERTVTGLDRGGVALYRMEDVEALRSDAEAAQAAKAREAAAPSVAARAARVSERLEDLHRLLTEGRSREEAARIAGYRSVNSARAAASGAGRADIQALLCTRVKAGPAEVEERIRVLEELLTNGDAVGDAWKRAGWTSRSAAERSLHRHDRHDLASWIRTGTRPAVAQERAA
ncbi:hypothetical protein [Kocuria rosea]|uniref:hypothetical protein n=1 Tax=Kocuria rosea TaxID=1275 RepID=UPI003D343932